MDFLQHLLEERRTSPLGEVPYGVYDIGISGDLTGEEFTVEHAGIRIASVKSSSSWSAQGFRRKSGDVSHFLIRFVFPS
ncbi:MAG: hypothetical protein HYU64_18765 [Armatimonadetes bacterium]|nr:hypothetical protein [Armatimonadota bacterium]